MNFGICLVAEKILKKKMENGFITVFLFAGSCYDMLVEFVGDKVEDIISTLGFCGCSL